MRLHLNSDFRASGRNYRIGGADTHEDCKDEVRVARLWVCVEHRPEKTIMHLLVLSPSPVTAQSASNYLKGCSTYPFS